MSTYLFINELKQGRGLENINSIIIDFLRSNGIVAVQPESNPDIKIEIDQYGYLRVNNHSLDKIPIMVKESFPPIYQYPEISDEKKVNIEMTLTSPNCPVAESLPKMVKDNVLKIEEVSNVDLKLVWSPPWTKDMMSESAKLELNL